MLLRRQEPRRAERSLSPFGTAGPLPSQGNSLRLRLGLQFDFDQVSLRFAFVAERVIEGGTKHPLLCPLVPLGPGVARYMIGAAGFADVADALSVFRHTASLP